MALPPHKLVEDIKFMNRIEQFVANTKPNKKTAESLQTDVNYATEIRDCAKRTIKKCRECRKDGHSKKMKAEETDITDGELLQASGLCDSYALKQYANRLQHVPKIVNVVSRVVAEPMPGSNTSLPLDLNAIVTRCSGAYFWPVRFCPVQIAFHAEPRTRVLIFHTGKIVGTGSKGPMSARLAVLMTIRKLAQEADVHLKVSKFEVKNLVGTVGLNATINCEGLAQRYSDKAHYDKSSFGGLQWRPFDQGICCEIFATGRMNLPNALTHDQLLEQFAKIEPILVQYSSAGNTSTHETLQTKQESEFDESVPMKTATPDDECLEDPQDGRQTINGYVDDEDIWDGWE